MIVGNGLIAKALADLDTDDVIIFASGVSNSLETRISEFERENTLLQNIISENPEKKLVYFSTLSIADATKQGNLYIQHKLAIEKYIQENCSNFVILRIGNIIGKGGNPNTLFNFLKNKIQNNEKFSVHLHARRLLIDMDDIHLFLKKNLKILDKRVINLAFPYYFSMQEIVAAMEKTFAKKANYEITEEGDHYLIDFSSEVENIFNNKNSEQYLEIINEKYAH